MDIGKLEQYVYDYILGELGKKPCPEPRACDDIFGEYYRYLLQCESHRLASRAAWFSRERLIPAVIDLERRLSNDFHKGALFHDAGLAHLFAGNVDGYEYFLAMTDEEEVRKTNDAHKRGTTNLLSGKLAAPIAAKRMKFACALLNGEIAGNPVGFAFMTGRTEITESQLDGWRLTLEHRHQFELLRIIHDLDVFVGNDYPKYPQCADNPFILLRLAKALSHFAQLVESCLTVWQLSEPATGDTLAKKLSKDKDFGTSLCTAAGLPPGRDNPFIKRSSNAENELRRLLSELPSAPSGTSQREWRLLRILLLVRNSTAHTIKSNSAIYSDRRFLLDLLQVVFVSLFTICQLKNKLTI